MKLKQWLYGATALAMLAACSDKDIAPGAGGENGSNPGEVVSGYIAVQINLPQETGTRAEGDYQKGDNPDLTHPGLNDVFKDGEAYEYKVDNALVVLFKGAKGSDGKDLGDKEAVYYRSQELTKPFFENSPADDNITSSYITAIPVEATLSDNIYAMVVLNRDKTTFVLESNGNLTIADQPVEKGKTKFSDILDFTTTNSFVKTEVNGKTQTYSRFFMTNAPLSTKIGGQGGDADALNADPAPIQYLVYLGNGDAIYDTEADAKANVKNCVYVERAMAKVTYQNGKFDKNAIKFKPEVEDENLSAYENSGFTIMGVDDEGNNIKIEADIEADVDYNLTHTNNISYVIRNVELDDHFSWGLNCKNEHNITEYRMVSGTAMPKLNSPFHEEQRNLYRTYWCKDPNYSVDMGANRKDLTIADGFKQLSSPLYCKENTFNVANQKHGNSTLAVFRMNYHITYKVGDEVIEADNLYTRGGDNSTVYISKRAAAAEEITRIAKNPHIRAAMAKCVKAGVTNTTYSVTDHIEIETVIKDITTEEGNVLPSQLWITGIKLKLPSNADGTDVVPDEWFDKESVKKFAEIIGSIDGTATSKYDEDGTPLGNNEAGEQIYSTPQTHKELVGAANLLNDITVYKEGISYYAIPIKHFGDHYTPWKNIQGTTTTGVYNGGLAFSDDNLDHAKKYLGRYGMVRNNWYELNISDVRALGFATIPNIDDELSDDNLEVKKYIGLEIHILSWAKRNQSVQF